MDKIAIIYTTFLRDELMYKTVQSIVDNLPNTCMLFIGDQGDESDEKFTFYAKVFTQLNGALFRYNQSYDCGLSYARNNLINYAYNMGYKYCLITADSIEFTDKYNFLPYIEVLENDPELAKIGFKLNNRQSMVYNLSINTKQQKFMLSKPEEVYYIKGNKKFQQVDYCNNFFLAKTEALLDIPWDITLKLCEHEDHCYRLKEKGWKTYYTESLSANYIDDKPEEYKKMRDRLYNEYALKLKEKYNLKSSGGWLCYEHKLKGK